MRGLHSLLAILLALGLIGAPPLAQAELSESPITPGFWSFANRKSETTQDVRAACRNYIEIRFADGHYIGLRIYKTESGVAVREVGEVGRCTFNRETQVEHTRRMKAIFGPIFMSWSNVRRTLAGLPPMSASMSPLPVQLTGLVGNAVCIVAAAGAVASGAVSKWSRIAVRRAAMVKRS